jgi:transcriptional regulator GlxA family with amidase domain
MATPRPLRDQIWRVLGNGSVPRWYNCSKYLLEGKRGNVIGDAGVMRECTLPGNALGGYHRLTPACEHVLGHYGQPIHLGTLARRVHLSMSQLQREFVWLFLMSPGDYFLRLWLLMARSKLESSGEAVCQITLDCGFHAQSHFTRAFRTETGLAQREFRRRFIRQASVGAASLAGTGS